MEFQQNANMIILGDAGESNPYHLFFYMIARFHFVDNGNNVIEYHYPNKKDCYISESALTNLPPRFKRELTKREGVIYGEIRPLRCYVDSIDEPWVYHYLRDLYKHIWTGTTKQKGKYTYISRSKNSLKSRRVLNEDCFTEDLRKMGFSIYNMEDLSFQDQIRLFRSSEIITGPHGAALSFALFCEENTVLCEIHPDIQGKAHFADISNKCKLRFYRFSKIHYFNEKNHDMVIDHIAYINSLKELIQLINQ